MTIEVNSRFRQAQTEFPLNGGVAVVSITPPLDADYFLACVVLSADQAIQIFPKFGTIGCGFAKEKDWNTNLPLSCDAAAIFAHIKHNKGSESIADRDCIEAIKTLQAWWAENGAKSC